MLPRWGFGASGDITFRTSLYMTLYHLFGHPSGTLQHTIFECGQEAPHHPPKRGQSAQAQAWYVWLDSPAWRRPSVASEDHQHSTNQQAAVPKKDRFGLSCLDVGFVETKTWFFKKTP